MGVLLERGGTLSNASFARLLGWGRTVGDQRLFQAETLFRAGSAVVVCLYCGGEGPKGCFPPLLGADSKWNAHGDSTVASDLMGSEFL